MFNIFRMPASRSHCSSSRPAIQQQVFPTMYRRLYRPTYTVRFATPNILPQPAAQRQNQNPPRPRTTARTHHHQRPGVPISWYTPYATPQSQFWFSPPSRITVPEPARHTEYIHPDLGHQLGIYPFLDWDIKDLPSSSTRRADPCTRRAPAFDQSATRSGSRNIQISYYHPTFNPLLSRYGMINVYPLGSATDIKIENVMDAIYRHFHQPITPQEWNSITLAEQQQILETYGRRINSSHRLRAYEVARGPLRIDILKGCTRFSGLQTVSSLNRSDILHLSLTPSV